MIHYRHALNLPIRFKIKTNNVLHVNLTKRVSYALDSEFIYWMNFDLSQFNVW